MGTPLPPRPVVPSLAATGLLLAVSLCPLAAQPPEVRFVDIGLEAGFQDRLSHGRALVAADWNGDGWVDFFVGNPGNEATPDESFIFLNDGPDGGGGFHWTKTQVLHIGEIAFGGSAIDYDNDGDVDLFVSVGGQEGIGLDYLYRNDAGYLTDVSEESGIRGPRLPNGAWVPTASSSGTWADYDNDGDLDLFVASRIVKESLDLPAGLGWRDSLFRNDGDGSFTDVTEGSVPGLPLSSRVAAWGDFDNDGWMDLFVPSDQPTQFRLYRNMQNGRFALDPLSEDEVDFGDRAFWTATVDDFNQDGLLDVISFGRRDGSGGSHRSHALLINGGHWRFTNEAMSSGLATPGGFVPATMGTQVGDFDNDGYPDVFTGNGGPLFGEADTLYWNRYTPETGLVFADASPLLDYPAPDDPACEELAGRPGVGAPTWVDDANMLAGEWGDGRSTDSLSRVAGDAETGVSDCTPEYPYRGHGAVFVDFDKDGDLDLAAVKGGTAILAPIVASTEPNRLFVNEGGNANNWLFVDLVGTVSSRDAYGARIEVIASRAGADRKHVYQQVQGRTGFSATGPDEIHFGLLDRDTVDEVRIWWPSGIETVLRGVAVNSRITATEDVLFSDDFNGGAAPDWTPISGDWRVVGEQYVQRGSPQGLVRLELPDLDDFAVAGKVTYLGGEGSFGLLGRVSADGSTYYGAMIEDGVAQLYKSVAGFQTPLGAPLHLPAVTSGGAFIVSLEMTGSTIRMKVDRRLVTQGQDDEIASGSVALATSGTAASFDNIAVY